MSNTTNHRHVAIVGSGPAGYTAAIYAARAGLTPTLFAGMQPGGQLMTTTDVENFPGYPDGIMGPEMMEDFRKQAERFGTELRYEIITKADLTVTPKRIWNDAGEEFTADAVIISTGASAKWLGLPSEQQFTNYGVSACAVCDGFFFKGQNVAIVGGGDTACEEALYLSKVTAHVDMLVRKDSFRASKIMANRVMNTPNITIHWFTETVEVLGDKRVSGVRVRNIQTGEEKDLSVTGFFVAIGHKPNTDIFQGQLDMDETGYLIVQPGSTRTNIEGVFVAGDAADKQYRQAITAAGTGCMAALDAERWLAAQEH